MIPLIVIIGQSGSGKTMVCDHLEEKYGIKQIRTFTTRKPRDVNDNSHIWADIKDYEYAKENFKIIAETEFGDDTYWTLASQIDGKRQSLVVDNNGLRALFNTDYPIVVIHIWADKNLRYQRIYDEAYNKRMRGKEPTEEAQISAMSFAFGVANERINRDHDFEVIKCDHSIDGNCDKEEMCKRIDGIVENYL